MKNEAESQAVFAVSYVRNVRGRAMLPDSTVCLNSVKPFSISNKTKTQSLVFVTGYNSELSTSYFGNK